MEPKNKRMTDRQKDEFHKHLTTVLLSVIAIFGVYSLILLSNVNRKLNDLANEQTRQQTKMEWLSDRVTKLENVKL
jgi:cell division protein FtsB